MKLNNKNLNVRELSAKELHSINGGGKGWELLGRILGTIKNAAEAIYDGMTSVEWDRYNIS